MFSEVCLIRSSLRISFFFLKFSVTWNFHWQVIVTSAGSMAFEEMSQSMEKLLASADEKLQAAGIREVGQPWVPFRASRNKMYLMSLFILKDVAEGLEGTVTDTFEGGPGGVERARRPALCVVHG